MKLWLAIAAVILAVTAFGRLERWGHSEGMKAAADFEREMRMADCLERFPKYRCDMGLAEVRR